MASFPKPKRSAPTAVRTYEYRDLPLPHLALLPTYLQDGWDIIGIHYTDSETPKRVAVARRRLLL